MKKTFLILFLNLLLSGCDAEDAPNCIKTSGDIIVEEVEVPSFEEIIVYERVKLFIEQGREYKVRVETGANLRKDVFVEVQDKRLILRNENSCNLLRNYGITKIYVSTPTLSWLQNSSGSAIESLGSLNFPQLWLRSFKEEGDSGLHTNGDFILDLEVEDLKITNDNVSNYFLTGIAGDVKVAFESGDGRLEAGELNANNYEILHRGTNKLIVNPQESIKGNIFGFGDVILRNNPPEIDVEEHYTGKLIIP